MDDMHYTYKPGVFGYGQSGPDGDAGLRGSSIYYSALSSKSDILNAVRSGKSLSDNDSYDESAEYMVGDVILTQEGDIYVVYMSESMLNVKYSGNIVSSSTKSEMVYNIKLKTDEPVTDGWINPYFVPFNYADPRLYMKEYETGLLYGYKISFTFDADESVESIKAFIRSNNGLRCAETIIDPADGECTMYVDMKWFTISEDEATAFSGASIDDASVYTMTAAEMATEYMKNNSTLVLECTMKNGSVRRYFKDIYKQ